MRAAVARQMSWDCTETDCHGDCLSCAWCECSGEGPEVAPDDATIQRDIMLVNGDVKFCATCLRRFPATVDYFHRDKDRRDGLTRKCRWCRTAEMAVQRGAA